MQPRSERHVSSIIKNLANETHRYSHRLVQTHIGAYMWGYCCRTSRMIYFDWWTYCNIYVLQRVRSTQRMRRMFWFKAGLHSLESCVSWCTCCIVNNDSISIQRYYTFVVDTAISNSRPQLRCRNLANRSLRACSRKSVHAFAKHSRTGHNLGVVSVANVEDMFAESNRLRRLPNTCN